MSSTVFYKTASSTESGNLDRDRLVKIQSLCFMITEQAQLQNIVMISADGDKGPKVKHKDEI